MNAVKTAVLLGLLSCVLVVGGGAAAGRTGLMIGLVLAVGMNFFSYFFSDKLALASYSAQPVTPEENGDVYQRVYPLVWNLVQKMGLPMPKLWLLPDSSPNAFATGRNPQNASVAFTEGILQLMSDRELEGVVAHELGHVLHRDILISSVAATLAGAITYLSQIMWWFGGSRDDEREGGGLAGIVMMILGPIAAGLIQMAISRTREFSADEASAKYTGSPDELIQALGKLENGVARVPMTDASPASAHLFILNPFGAGGMSRMFSTHPSTEERIARLQAMRGDAFGNRPVR
ncbi:MAG TPA: zinc metalloprotease HtpX [Bryobacteraceae bacterium]|nr:zinc metalloprotease HtpX [Bryobacteraceae bacterium]